MTCVSKFLEIVLAYAFVHAAHVVLKRLWVFSLLVSPGVRTPPLAYMGSSRIKTVCSALPADMFFYFPTADHMRDRDCSLMPVDPGTTARQGKPRYSTTDLGGSRPRGLSESF